MKNTAMMEIHHCDDIYNHHIDNISSIHCPGHIDTFPGEVRGGVKIKINVHLSQSEARAPFPPRQMCF